MVSGDRVCNCEKGVGACASGLVWVCCFEKDIWSVCFQATHTRGLARTAAAYASASSACPDADAEDADGARKKSETLGSEPAGLDTGREILPPARARGNLSSGESRGQRLHGGTVGALDGRRARLHNVVLRRPRLRDDIVGVGDPGLGEFQLAHHASVRLEQPVCRFRQRHGG